MDLSSYIENSPFPWFKEWYQNRIGPSEYLGEIRARSPLPKWWTVNSAVHSIPFSSARRSFRSLGGSVSIDLQDGVTRAIGEAIERYSAVNALSRDDLFDQEVAPELLSQIPVCAEHELGKSSFKASGRQDLGPVPHSMAKSLLDDSEYALPAEFIHLLFSSPRELIVPTSNGSAFHGDLVSAIWGGIGESLERDALMCTWIARDRPPRIELEGRDLPAALAIRLRRIKATGLKLDLFLSSTEHQVPSVISVIRGNAYPYFSLGGSAKSDIYAACIKAIDEAMGGQLYAEHGPAYHKTIRYDEFSWVDELDDHTHLYYDWKDAPAFDFLLQKGPSVHVTDLAEESWFPQPESMEDLQRFARMMKGKGIPIYYKDRSLPELAHAGKVVKVVIPPFIPLIVEHNARWLASTRIQDRLKGRAPNPYPHPMP